MNLFLDQKEFVSDIRDAFRGNQCVLAQAPTGFGKTVVAAHIAQSAAAKNNRVIFTVHRKNLIHQTASTFEKFRIPYGVIASGRDVGHHELVQIASIQSLVKRLDSTQPCDLLVVDECHLACSPSWSKVLTYYRERGARVLGNTATPARLDGRPLSDHFDTIVVGPSMRRLIDAGRLSDYRAFAPSSPDMEGVRKLGGDFVAGDVEKVVDVQNLVGDAVAHYNKLMPGKRALAFCVSIKASEITAARFCDAGIPASHIDGTTPDHERQRLIGAFADGSIKVLTNVDLITTGFDLSSQVGYEVPVQGIILLRPTQSVTLHLQMIGRGMRYKDEPAIIQDHAGNVLRHGLPDDEREWTLEGRRKKSAAEETGPSVQLCEWCFFMYNSLLPACPNCGTAHKVADRTGPLEVDGELVEIEAARHRAIRAREEGQAKGLEALVALARERGYKASWAGIRHAVRTKGDRMQCIRDAQRIWRDGPTT